MVLGLLTIFKVNLLYLIQGLRPTSNTVLLCFRYKDKVRMSLEGPGLFSPEGTPETSFLDVVRKTEVKVLEGGGLETV